jgi:MFS family permease
VGAPWTAWAAIGTVVSPLIGGQLVDTTTWRFIFAINLPLVLVTVLLILRAVPAGGQAQLGRARRRPRGRAVRGGWPA